MHCIEYRRASTQLIYVLKGGVGGMNQSSSNIDFMNGGGEMGALMRARDWTRTPLGNPETWPAASEFPPPHVHLVGS
jgi:hypothetical protein